MTPQELPLRVGELATRIGYPIPSVEWTSEQKYHRRGIVLEPNATFGPTLHVHESVEHHMPAGVQDFLVAQELIQARLGARRERRWIVLVINLICFLLGLGSVTWVSELIDSLWSRLLVALVISWIFSTVIRLLIGYAWSARVHRRSDRQLAEVLGREAVVSALTWYVDIGWRPSVRWLLAGATPTPQSRLRRLGVLVTD